MVLAQSQKASTIPTKKLENLMILADIKHYLSSQHSATLNDLSIHFDTAPEALRDMLQLWVQKGKIRKIQTADLVNHG